MSSMDEYALTEALIELTFAVRTVEQRGWSREFVDVGEPDLAIKLGIEDAILHGLTLPADFVTAAQELCDPAIVEVINDLLRSQPVLT